MVSLEAAMELTPARIAGDRRMGRESLEIRSPYDGHCIGKVPVCGYDEVELACRQAERLVARGAFPQHARAAVLTRTAACLVERAGSFVRLLAREAGKPVQHGRVEVARAADTLRLSAAEALKLAGTLVPMEATAAGAGRLGFALRRPIGVVAAITPFNFPLNLVAHKLGPAIAAGCPVVLKPAPQTPIAALELVELLVGCGLPSDWISVVTDRGREAAEPLVAHPIPRLITFTGSVDVGLGIARAAPTKRVRLELGSNSPLILEPDADLDRLAQTVGPAAFGYAGQCCISVQRVLCHRSVYAPVGELLVASARALSLGDPEDPSTDLGPLIRPSENERLREWLAEATHAGARILTGGDVEERIFLPTVVDEVPTHVRLFQKEVFGPVVALRPYDTFDEAIALANETETPLQVGLFTRDLGKALDAAQRLAFGGVLINHMPTYRTDQQPYGGLRNAGNAREGPAYAIEDMTELRFVSLRA
jgi:acyl-CoA reductase-like NAD-dependent aldehyde dehydrogenase